MPSLSHSSETESIVGIQFGVFSPEEIVRRSVVEVKTHSTQEGKIAGLADPRLGVLENGKLCRTCGQNNHGCPGHFGHYALARPVYYIQFYGMVQKILRCVCIKCAKLLINKDAAKALRRSKGENRWKAVLTACQNVTRCGEQTEDGCGARQPHRYHDEDICRIVAEWKDLPAADGAPAGEKTLRRFLEPEYVHRLLRRVSDEDVDFMGFSRMWCRPDWMMCSVIAIPPPQVRPSVLQDNNQRSEDDLTQKLIDIIKTNATLNDKITAGAKKKAIDEWTLLLQYHVATLVNNDIPGVAQSAQRSGRPLKSLQQRLGTKEGRIRNNLQGKRVEFSARSVITPDPNISVEELGVPMKIAMNLTFPERVTAFNIDRLYALVKNGPDTYPGAKSVQRASADGQPTRMISLKHVKTETIQLYEGDVVNRHLLDGDPVLFNRQPSLHRMSMMCHRVRVLPYSTFRLNVSVTKPYNADFDGDEMNMHVPQSVEAATELREIAAVSKQMISPRLSKPLVSVVQDTLVGVNRLTRPTEFFSRREFMNLLVHSKRWDGRVPPPAKTDPVPLWSGQQVVSCLLPAVHIAMGNKMWDKKAKVGDQNYVIINNGILEQGILDGDVFDKALIHILYNDFSPEMTVDFIDSLQAVVATYLQNSGFSVGLSDIIADADTLGNISAESEKLKANLESLQLQVHMGLFDNTSGRSNQEEFEGKVFQNLDKITGAAGKIGLSSLTAINRMVNMVKCGSKGSDTNIAQMIALLGQQAIEGKRIGYGFQDRTLPHFKRYDDGADARGYIESSFVKGLNPAEFFFHAMTGREGLIDTAVKSVTADTLIVIQEHGVTKTVRIGDWIDAHLSANAAEVEYFPEEADLEMLQLEAPTYIPSVAPNGTVTWGKVAAVTRHDPGKQLYRVETLGGRSVIVTASKSLLIWNPATQLFEQRNTPDVRPGDCMPVTMALPEPPVVTSSFDVARYLPKDTYLYGTDFHAAQQLVDSAMEDRERVSAGWWAANNGKTFTLPYENKGRFVCTLSRSKTDNIHPGFVYPFSSNRDCARIPDQLPLTEENGIFLGLFLAEGNVDVKSGYVGITNNAPEIRQFVHDWFENLRIRTSEESHVNAIGGTTTSVRGYSTVLAKLLDELCGHGAANKRVPAEAFTAPLPFIKGILNGYLSGDGTITHNSVESGSASQALTEGIAMLLSRLGIFAKVFTSQLKSNNIGTETILATHRLSVRAQWATRLATAVTLLDATKAQKLVVLSATASHRNFPVQGDCVLDEITEITPVSPDAYPKMYDLTVPDTFTFGLANGLQVYDTADSGYMQRKLVKTMEDFTTYHDGTVRDAGGLIVQFAYGDDGTSATKIENQPIRLGEMSDSDIRGRFAVEDVAAEKSQRYIEAIIRDRDILVKNVWGGRVESTVQSAVHLGRLISNTIQQLGLKAGTGEPVSGAHVLDTIDRILKRTRADNLLWGALLRYYLNPRDLRAGGFTRAAFDWLAEQIVVKHMRSWAAPGEMSGIIAAQSLGEPTTQMTLNTFHLAGVAAKSGMTRGVPRLKELLQATQNPRATSLTIALRPDIRNSKEVARRLAQELEFTMLKDLVTTSSIYYDPRDSASLIAEDQEWLSFFAEFEQNAAPALAEEGVEETGRSPWIIRMELDREKMFNKNITMEDINFVLRKNMMGALELSYTDHNAPRMVLRSRIFREKAADHLDHLAFVKHTQNTLLTTTLVRGLPGLRAVSFRRLESSDEVFERNPASDGKYEAVPQFVLDTFGTNFIDTMIHPDVDGSRLISNHVHDIYENLGIEAARAILFKEIFSLFEQAAPVNYRHVSLLVDAQCSRGRLMSADRIGVNRKQKIGPLAKASFEQTENIMLRAAMFGEMDAVTGVAANIMTGQPIKGGTSFTQVLLDEAAFEELMKTAPAPRRVLERAPGLVQAEVDALMDTKQAPGCRTEDLRIPVALPTMDPGVQAGVELPDMEIVLVDE